MDTESIQKFPILRSVYGGLTKSERRIADYIAVHTAQVMEQTISEIAQKTQSPEVH